MILAYRYQELMEYIEVTPEMRERILGKLRTASPFPAQNARFLTKILPFPQQLPRFSSRKLLRRLSAAACLLLLLGAGLFHNFHRPDLGENQAEAIVGPEEKLYDSVTELSAAAGFPVPDIADALPFSMTRAEYSLLWEELAQAVYFGGEGEEIMVRAAPGTEDASGVYEEYQDLREWKRGGRTVTLKGRDGLYSLAVWTAEGRAYSIYTYQAYAEEQWGNILSAALRD